MLETLREFIASLPPLLQWLGVMLAGAIPFIESYLGSAVGVWVGVPTVIAIVAAVVGNILSMAAFVLSASAVRQRVRQGETKPVSARRERLRRSFDRYGVVGVSLLGQFILASQITSVALVSFGASRQRVIAWQIVGITLWGVVFGVLAHLGVDLIRGR